MNVQQMLCLISTPSTFKYPIQQSLPVEPCNNDSQLHTSLSCEDIVSNSVSTVRILTACTARRDLNQGYCIHAKVVKSGLDNNVFVCNSLLDMYVKCGNIDDAAKLFEFMPERTVVSWTSMMSGYCQNGAATEAISTFWQMLESTHPNEYTLAVLLRACVQKGDSNLVQIIHCYIVRYGFLSDKFLQNSVLDAYARSGLVASAEKLMDRLSCRDVVSWTSVISGCVANGLMKKALMFFAQMQEDGVVPNVVTILSLLQACSLIKERSIFRWIHGFIIKGEWYNDALVVNSLVETYTINGYFLEGINIFSELCFAGEGLYLSPQTMANLLQGCSHFGYLKLGKQIHGYLSKHGFFPCLIIENSLINLYAENKLIDSAFLFLRIMSRRDIVSWNTLIKCLVNNGQSFEALELLSEIHSGGERETFFPDFITMLSSIQACSNVTSLLMGQVIHGYITKAGMLSDVFIQNALVDMYGKSGSLDHARQVFKEMPETDLGSWNSMIAAQGINGQGDSAVQTFTELIDLGIYRPNAITFVNVLSACAHAGLVKEGFKVFDSMEREHGVEPRMEHYACMVDLLGRSGKLEEAEAFIRKMPVCPGPAVWGALLGACGLFGNVEIAERAVVKLSVLEPDNKVWRVAISNIYASVGRWEDAAMVRAQMRETGRDGGWSSIEVKGKMFKFMAADITHAESKRIYSVLNVIQKHIRDSIAAY